MIGALGCLGVSSAMVLCIDWACQLKELSSGGEEESLADGGAIGAGCDVQGWWVVVVDRCLQVFDFKVPRPELPRSIHGSLTSPPTTSPRPVPQLFLGASKPSINPLHLF